MVGVPITSGKPLARRFRGVMLGERLRPRIGTRHRVGRLQRLFGGNVLEVGIGNRIDSVEQCKKRDTPRFIAAASTISVPRKLTS